MKTVGTAITRDDVTGRFGGETRNITIDGVTYQVDLRQETFDALVGKVVQKGRRVARPVRENEKEARKNTGVDNRAARIWLRGHGFKVPTHGPVSAELMETYIRMK